tara:strand:- start:212 stop:469 length:258 start_codon:yes stop_codon:yes gene_type:complete
VKHLKQVGPFGKAEAFLEGFIFNATRSAMFMELLEEMDRLEAVILEGSEEEKKLAEMLHKQLEEQFILMITPVDPNDKARSRKNI